MPQSKKIEQTPSMTMMMMTDTMTMRCWLEQYNSVKQSSAAQRQKKDQFRKDARCFSLAVVSSLGCEPTMRPSLRYLLDLSPSLSLSPGYIFFPSITHICATLPPSTPPQPPPPPSSIACAVQSQERSGALCRGGGTSLPDTRQILAGSVVRLLLLLLFWLGASHVVPERWV